MTTVEGLLAEYWWLAVALGLASRAFLAWQRELTWPEYRTLHGLKRLTFPVAHPYAKKYLGFSSLINDKGGRDDAEYIDTMHFRPRDIVRSLRAGGGSLHLLASLKRRPDGTLSWAHVVWDHGTDQTEAYIFANGDGSTDVYSHFEPSPETPVEHLGGDLQTDGDPRGVVRDALGV